MANRWGKSRNNLRFNFLLQNLCGGWMQPWSGGGGDLVTKSCPTLVTPWTVACQAPLSTGLSRHEYWSGLPFSSPGDLPDPGIDPGSPALQADSLPTELRGKPQIKRRHEVKRRLFLARKAMTNLDHIIKSRDFPLPKEVCLVKAMFLPVVMCGCERWTVKKAERWKIDALELWCWRRLLRVPWTEKRSNQSLLKGINPEYSWEYLMLKLNSKILATWWEETTHWKRRCFGKAWREKEMEAAEDEMGGWHHWLDGHEFEPSPGHAER